MHLFQALDPEDWRRCECGKLVRTTSQQQLKQHMGHLMRYATGLRLHERIYIMLGWL